MIGIPIDRFLGLPIFGIFTRFTGVALYSPSAYSRLSMAMYFSLGIFQVILSIPGVLLPLFEHTPFTASDRASQVVER